MEKEILELKKKFKEISRMGFVKSINKGYGGIGRTFEDLIGIKYNKSEEPDFLGIEIKTKRLCSRRDITLFASKPEGPSINQIEIIKKKYGYPHKIHKNYRILNASADSIQLNKVGLFRYFKLRVDRQKGKIFLEVYNTKRELIDDETYWTIEKLEQKVTKKLKVLALITALSQRVNGVEYFKYYDFRIYHLKTNKFIDLIESGIIRINFKIGVYLTGAMTGKTYDRGTSFEINEDNLEYLFEKCPKYE